VGVEQRDALVVEEQDRAPAAGPVPGEELGDVREGVEEQFRQAALVAHDLAAAGVGVRQEHGHVQIAGRGGAPLGGRAAQDGAESLRETGGDQA
jgi:hypothetical protein